MDQYISKPIAKDNVLYIGISADSATRDTLRNAAVIYQIDTLGLLAFDIPSDGNCLLHALSFGLFGFNAPSRAAQLSKIIVKYMAENRTFFELPIDNGRSNEMPSFDDHI